MGWSCTCGGKNFKAILQFGISQINHGPENQSLLLSKGQINFRHVLSRSRLCFLSSGYFLRPTVIDMVYLERSNFALRYGKFQLIYVIAHELGLAVPVNSRTFNCRVREFPGSSGQNSVSELWVCKIGLLWAPRSDAVKECDVNAFQEVVFDFTSERLHIKSYADTRRDCA